ncbi:MAG: hypothetical protein KatS3mg092_0040 [Patescibacteria group bacterium]|nr:MAG: hypothetical protein KatS3mg092_0040 [Patescibacteria group bacterium]
MISFWLLTEDSWINDLIKKFANEFKIPLFLPHITLISGLEISEKDGVDFLQKLKKEFKPFNLKIIDIDFKKEIHKSFYLKTELNDNLLNLRLSIESNFKKNKFNNEFNPHISLFYFNCGNNKKIKLKNELIKKIPFVANFNKLGLIIESFPIKKPQDIKNWKLYL